MVVRQAQPADAPVISACLASSFLGFKQKYTVASYQSTTPNARHLLDHWDDGPVWVAEVGGPKIVGTVGAVPSPKGVYVRRMGVLPEARGRGVGRALLDAVEAFARTSGANRMYLSTTPFLDAAIGLYERAGFVRTDAGPHDLLGTPLFTMEKLLMS